MFATAVPGLGSLLADELDDLAGVAVRDWGHDGRADVVLFDAEPGAVRRARQLRLAEDVFAEVGRTLRADGDRPDWIAGRIWRPGRVNRALRLRSVADRATFRVVARVRQERSFLRTELRREFTRAIARDRPRWRGADPAQVEVWVTEYRSGRLVAGVRLSDARMRQHDGRAAERGGALRPTVAAAMVRLAGKPDGTLLDPCCGSGTILTEAARAGWTAYGLDIDPDAVAVARRNGATAGQGDARDLPMKAGEAGAAVSNLPFGRQYGVPEPMETWLATVLAELARVTTGTVVVLTPAVPRSAVPPGLRLVGRHPLRLLGTPTTIWVYERLSGR